MLVSYSLAALSDLALGAQVGDDLLDADLLDHSQAAARHPELHEALLVLHPKALRVQIRQEPALRLVVRVGNLVARHRPFPGDLANLRHRWILERGVLERSGTIPAGRGVRQGWDWLLFSLRTLASSWRPVGKK